jgi:hypothetical protein
MSLFAELASVPSLLRHVLIAGLASVPNLLRHVLIAGLASVPNLLRHVSYRYFDIHTFFMCLSSQQQFRLTSRHSRTLTGLSA